MQRTSAKRRFTEWGPPALGCLILLVPLVLVVAVVAQVFWSISADRHRRVVFEIPVRLVPEGENNSVRIRCIVPENDYVCDLHVAIPDSLPEDYQGAAPEFGYRVTDQKGHVLAEGKTIIDLSPDRLKLCPSGWSGVIPLFAAAAPETHLHIRINLPPASDVPVFLHDLSLRFLSYSDWYKQDVGEEI